jgi:hypothetical protein
MNIKWTLTRGDSLDAQPKPDFTAFDGAKAIGRVCQIEDGPVRGLWFWTMAVGQAGSPSGHPTCGRATEGGKAGRCLIEAYQALLTQLPTQSTPRKVVGSQ